MNFSSVTALPFIYAFQTLQETANLEYSLHSLLNVGAIIFLLLTSTFILLLCIPYGNGRKSNNFISGKKKIPLVSYFPIKVPTIIDGFYTLFKLQKDGLKFCEELRSKYGNIFRLPSALEICVVVLDPAIAQKILTSTNPGHLNKPRHIYDRIFVSVLNDGLLASEYGVWSVHRKQFSKCFTYKYLQSFLPYMNQHGKSLVKELQSICAVSADSSVKGKQVYDLIWSETVKIIIQTLAGEDFVQGDKIEKGQNALRRGKEIVAYRLLHPHLLIGPVWSLHPMSKELENISKFLRDMTQDELDRFRKIRDQNMSVSRSQSTNDDTESKTDNLEDSGIKVFKTMAEEVLSSGLSDKEILDQVATFLLAGHETTSLAISMLLFHLAANPQCQDLCREEVNRLHNSVPDENQKDYDLTMDDLTNLKYLERCILEGLRLTAIAPLFFRQLQEPLKLDEDLVLEEGTTVIFSPWVMHRDPNNFPNPTKFDPDRFLPESIKERHPHAFLSFSTGQRNCIGYKYAMVEVKTILALILRNFEISTTDKPEDINYFTEITLMPDREINVILKARK